MKIFELKSNLLQSLLLSLLCRALRGVLLLLDLVLPALLPGGQQLGLQLVQLGIFLLSSLRGGLMGGDKNKTSY